MKGLSLLVSNGRIYLLRHVTFNETFFPFSALTSTSKTSCLTSIVTSILPIISFIKPLVQLSFDCVSLIYISKLSASPLSPSIECSVPSNKSGLVLSSSSDSSMPFPSYLKACIFFSHISSFPSKIQNIPLNTSSHYFVLF